MLPVVLDDGVTALSTLTQVFTVANTVTIEPSPMLSLPLQPQLQTSASGFFDLDTELEDGVD